MSAQTVAKPEIAVPAAAHRSFRPLAMFGLVALPVVLLDQLSKYLVSTHLEEYTSRIPVIPGWLDITYTLNPGAAFSLFATMPAWFRNSFFVTLSVIAIIVLGVLIVRNKAITAVTLGMAAILGGTIGNLIDRLASGRVIDFIYFHHAWFNYPVFNLADSAITIGVILIVAATAFEKDSAASGEPRASSRSRV